MIATKTRLPVKVYYECCQVLAIVEFGTPCWSCGAAIGFEQSRMDAYHPSQKVWHLTPQGLD